jgi:hypothetical protein
LSINWIVEKIMAINLVFGPRALVHQTSVGKKNDSADLWMTEKHVEYQGDVTLGCGEAQYY